MSIEKSIQNAKRNEFPSEKIKVDKKSATLQIEIQVFDFHHRYVPSNLGVIERKQGQATTYSESCPRALLRIIGRSGRLECPDRKVERLRICDRSLPELLSVEIGFYLNC